MSRRRRAVKNLLSDGSDEEPLSKIASKKPNETPPTDESSSESDIESYLQPANKIDLNSSFFNVQKNSVSSFDQIESNIFSGVSRLTDSECEDETKRNEVTEATESIQATPSTSKLNFGLLHEYARKIEEAKQHVEEYTARKKAEKKELNIENLLAAGESKEKMLNIGDLRSSDFESCSDSDKEGWEEVKDEQKDKNLNLKEGLQITVNIPSSIKKRKEVDIQAAIKRRINKVRKENQVLVHKVHCLCWIAHGNYVNSKINSQHVLGMALSLLPSEKCYPPNRTDLKYLEQITKWFNNTITSIEQEVPTNKSLDELLQTQMTNKVAYNKTMLVYIFVAIVRSLGIACRLAMSFQVEPLRPPNRELLSLSTKTHKQNEKETEDKNTSNAKPKIQKVKTKTKHPSKAKSAKDTKDEEDKLNREPEAPSKSTKEHNKKPKEDENRHRSLLSKNTGKIELQSKSTSETVKPRLKNENKSKKKPTIDTKFDKIKIKLQPIKEAKSANTSESKAEGTASKKKIVKSGLDVSKKAASTRSRSKKLIPQLDGANDSNPTKPNLKILEQKQQSRCSIRAHPKRLTSIVKYRDTDSEDEFAIIRSPVSNERNSSKSNGVNLKKLKNHVAKVDVTNDVRNLVKKSIKEQNHLDKMRTVKKRKNERDSGNDSDYVPQSIKKKHTESEDDFNSKVKVKRRVQVKKDAAEEITKKKKGVDTWVEVFCESEEKWICVDVVKGQVYCVKELYGRASHPITYIIGWNNDNSLKDITKRYCPTFNTVTRKLRVDVKWWTETLKPFMSSQTARDREEDDQLERQHMDKPLPKSIAEYKNHPLYVLKRHLLKFEAMYPPDAPTLGFIRGEPVYSRQCVYTLHSRDIWLKHAKVVKPGQEPYKIVKARPRWDKLSNSIVTGELLEIFGPWQTQDYEPPTAENGIVPRNAFGNVELFKPCMLPKKTVHLQLPGLNKVARRMNIDCAPALVGFDFHGGWNHPTYDGYVVCEEFADVLIAAWDMEQEEIEKKELEKINKRVYGNWKKLIRGLLIRERLKVKYDLGENSRLGGEAKKVEKRLPKFTTKKWKK